MFAVTVRDATSTIDTSFDGPFAVQSVRPSRAIASPHGRSPAFTDPVTVLVAGSTKSTWRLRPVLTATNDPSADAFTPIGRMPSPSAIVPATVFVLVSTTASVAPFSDVT